MNLNDKKKKIQKTYLSISMRQFVLAFKTNFQTFDCNMMNTLIQGNGKFISAIFGWGNLFVT